MYLSILSVPLLVSLFLSLRAYSLHILRETNLYRNPCKNPNPTGIDNIHAVRDAWRAMGAAVP